MRKRLLVGAAIVLVIVVAAVRLLQVPELAYIGAGYAAEQTCACIFISGRTLESCQGDLEPLARMFVSIKRDADQVRARSFILSHATARFEKGYGCALKD